MPIRLNLLAEAQAAEDARRRDPVKRAGWLAALVIVLILVWSSSLQFKAILIKSEASSLEGQIQSHSKEYKGILDEQNKTADIKHKLEALRLLAADRLLQGTLLNSLQQTTVNDVQLIRLRVDQTYAFVEATKPNTNSNKVTVAGKPATSTEKILLTLEGTDSCPNPGDQLNKYKDALAANAYLKEALAKTNGIQLKSLAPPQISPFTGKRSVVFALECRYPDYTR